MNSSKFLTAEEFGEIVKSQPLDKVVEERVIRGTPWVFRENPTHFDDLRNSLSASLDIPPTSIMVVGSGKMGFSLSPRTRFRPFTEKSDIDVFIHDERVFDRIWMTFLKWHYPRRYTGLFGEDRIWAGDRKKDIYWGFLVPDEIPLRTALSFQAALKPIREIRTRWFEAFRNLGSEGELGRRRTSGRLYRTLEHACLYQAEGLRQIKQEIEET